MVQIDMEIPKSCAECDFLVYMRDFDATDEYPYCPYLANEIDDKRKRPTECPLQEVKE